MQKETWNHSLMWAEKINYFTERGGMLADRPFNYNK